MAWELDRLNANNHRGIPFQRLWQRNCEIIEAALTDITTAITDIETTQQRLNIGFSYTSPSLVVTATDAGSDVTVTVANHTRVYPDGTTVSITGTSFTGKAFSTLYAIYYDDTTLADTTPTFVITTTVADAQNNKAAGRHFVGTVTSPADGGAATSGGTTPSGAGGGTASGGAYTGGSGGGGVIP